MPDAAARAVRAAAAGKGYAAIVRAAEEMDKRKKKKKKKKKKRRKMAVGRFREEELLYDPRAARAVARMRARERG